MCISFDTNCLEIAGKHPQKTHHGKRQKTNQLFMYSNLIERNDAQHGYRSYLAWMMTEFKSIHMLIYALK